MDSEIIKNWPDFCFDGNRVCFQSMIKGLRRYGYIRDVGGAHDLHVSLKEDHPELFEFLVSYVVSKTAEKVGKALEEKKVQVVFDEQGNKKYEFQEDAFEMD